MSQSKITQSPPQVDAPLVQDANYEFDSLDRAYIDDQARGAQQHLVQSLLSGCTATWRTLDGSSASVATGDVVVLAGSAAGTVTRVTSGALIAAGAAFGIVLAAGTPGGNVPIATNGHVPPSITGLGASSGFARVNATTGRAETVVSLSSTDYALGAVDAAGNMRLAVSLVATIAAGAGQVNLTLSNGLNSNVATNGSLFQRIGGPSAAYSVGGLAPTSAAIAGQPLYLSDTTGQGFTIVHEDASSTAANRIQTPNGLPYVVTPGSKNTFLLAYDTTIHRWVLLTNGGQLPLYSNAKEFTAKGDGTTDDAAAMARLSTAASIVGGDAFIPPGTYRFASQVTFSCGVRFAKGAVFSPDAGVTLNLYGPVHAHPNQQIFSTTAAISFFNQGAAGQSYTSEIYLPWWGAKGDWAGFSSGTDNTNAIRSALAALGSFGKNSSGSLGGTLITGPGQFRYTDSLTVDSIASSGIAAWQAAHAYSQGDVRVPVTPNGFYYVAMAAGTSGGTAPAFTTTINSSVADGSGALRWRCLATTSVNPAIGVEIRGSLKGSAGQAVDTMFVLDFAPGVNPGDADLAGTGATLTASTGVLSGLPTGHNIQVGGWVYLSNVVTPGNAGAWKVSATATNAVTLYDPTAEWPFTDDVGGTGGIHWINPTRSGLRIWSACCKVKGIAFVPSNGRIVYGLVEDAQSKATGNTTACTANTFEDVYIDTQSRSSNAYLHGFVHGDNVLNPGNTPWDGDCENNRYVRCTAANYSFTGYYSPNEGGQTKDILFEQSTTNATSSTNPRAGHYQQSGSLTLRNPTMSATRIGAYAGASELRIYDIESEGVARIVKEPNSSGAATLLTMVGGRIAVDGIASDGKHIIWRGGGPVTLVGLHWDPTYIANFALDISNSATSAQPTDVVAVGILFPNMKPFGALGAEARITMLGCKGVIDNSANVYSIASTIDRQAPSTVAVVNGANNDLPFSSGSIYLTGPTGAFSVSGFQTGAVAATAEPGQEGATIDLYYFGTQALTIAHLTGSVAQNQIVCSTGASIVATPPSGGFLHYRLRYSLAANSGSGAWLLT